LFLLIRSLFLLILLVQYRTKSGREDAVRPITVEGGVHSVMARKGTERNRGAAR
jgi:hypothetical protein